MRFLQKHTKRLLMKMASSLRENLKIAKKILEEEGMEN